MRRVLKMGAAVLAFGLIALLLVVTNGLTGNPVSKWIAHNAAEKYLAETYPNQNLQVSQTNYSFKTGSYLSAVSSPDSIDTHFTLDISMTGKILYDRYESHVLSGFNTWQRMDTEYRQAVDRVLETLPYSFSIAYGTLAEKSDEESGYGLEKLELDYNYDIWKLGSEAGKIVLYLDADTADAKTAAQILTDVRNAFDASGVSFRAIDLELQAGDNHFNVRNVSQFLLDQPSLAESLEENAAQTEEYYQQQDQLKDIS